MPNTQSRLPTRLIAIVAGLFLAALVLHFAGVALLRYIVEKQLHPALPQGTYIGEVHLNLFSGRLEIEDFQLRRDDSLWMRFGRLTLDVSPWRLVGGRLHVEEARLANGYLRVERREDGSFDLGLPPFDDAGDTEPSDPAASPLAISLAGAAIDGLVIDYRDGDLRSVADFERVGVGAYDASVDTQQVPVEWALSWDGKGIAGDARVTLDGQGVAVDGRADVDPLDLQHIQRLARLEPVASGGLAYHGTFAWREPALELNGALQAASLAYRADGQSLQLEGLALDDFALALQTAPVLDARLTLAKALRVAMLKWSADGQGADVEGLAIVSGRFGFTRGGQASADGLQMNAAGLGWQDAQRSARLTGVHLAAEVRQDLTETAGLPILSGQLTAEQTRYTDGASSLALELGPLSLKDLALAAEQGGDGRTLAAVVSLADGRVEQGHSGTRWTAGQAKLDGRLHGDDYRLNADLGIDGLRIEDHALPHGPLSLARFSAGGLGIGPETRFERLRLEGLRLPGGIDETALQIAAVDISDGRYSEQAGVALGEIRIDGVQTGVVRSKDGAWQHVMSADQATAEPASPAAGATAGDEGPAWRIGRVRVTGDSHITVADRINPMSQPIRYRVERIEVGALASGTPDADTPFDIALRPDQYSEFVVAGTVRPLARDLHLKAEGHLHGFGLTSVNGLVADDLGHRFLDGQLDNDFSLSIDSNRLEMGNALGLAGLVVEEIDGKEGPPLATAIALLEDRDGNIKLEVPVSGNLDDPEFRVLGALNPIIMKAVAGTAALAIQPLGSVLLVGGLLANQALKVTFEPALFEPGSTTLNPAATRYLGQLAGKLSEKPKLAVRVCGVVADAERKKDKKGAYLDKEADLLAMAQKRADAVRAALTEQGAGKRQLRTCRPSLDADPAASPRVDIRF